MHGKKAIRSDKKYPEKCEDCEYKPKSNRNYIQHKLIYHSTSFDIMVAIIKKSFDLPNMGLLNKDDYCL